MNISQFFQLTPNVMIFRYAPMWFSTRYLRLLGRMYYIVNRHERHLIERNIKSVFQGKAEVHDIVKRTFDGIFSHYAEKLIMAHRKYDNVKKELWRAMEYSGTEYLDKALKKGGVILVTAHFGAVEFLPLALALRGYPATMVVKFQTERLKRSLMQRAEEVNVELIDCEEGRVLQRAMDSLKRGRILLTECDEVDEWKPRENQTIQAFGGRIHLDRSLEVLCRRSGSTAIGSFMVRTKDGYRLSLVPVGSEEMVEGECLSAAILKTFEQFVMMFPDQWYQWKKFHRMRPEIA
ncbi:MAG: hypothetical protein JXB48_18740 [Candidatus Latescibacteria bacterium]|nr:hypothetical protein [Candidatus Latescibacterota bacterium]